MLAPPVAKVTTDPEDAARLAGAGTPAVLVGKDAAALVATVGPGDGTLGAVGTSGSGNSGHECLLGVMVGDPSDPAVIAAALEMAAELWPWARRAG
jgi:hypothetical protein